jgi:hypothetical protein
MYAVPGTEFKGVKQPPTVRATAMCVNNNCLVTRRASGGKHRDMQTFAMPGTFDVLDKQGNTVGTLGSAEKPLPFFFHQETGVSNMPSKAEMSFGLGFMTGKNPTESSHIITGPSNFGPQVMKAEHPKN